MTITVAKIIIGQLGGNMFMAMAGIKKWTYTKNSVALHGPKRQGWNNDATVMKVTLNDRDMYDVEFIRQYGTKITTISTHTDVLCDELEFLFGDETGFATRL